MKLFAKFLIVLYLIIPVVLYAEEDIQEVNGEYFTVYFPREVDLLDIAYKIKLQSNFYIQKDSNRQIFRGGSPKEVLAENIDLLFKEVSDILDMQLYSYHGDIRIFSSKLELEAEFNDIFTEETYNPVFYNNENNTIYLVADNVDLELLAQTIADAIISHYFVVMPPGKVKDVLFEHVKYSISNKLKKE